MGLSHLINKIKYSDFSYLYNFHDEKATGRFWVMAHGVLGTTASHLTDGVFYTTFLTINGINIVDAGILAFVPYFASILSIASPYILERLPRRKWFLAITRFLHYLLMIIGITVLPEFVADPAMRMKAFVAIIITANIINTLGGQGYTVWHAQFLPDQYRTSYFTYNPLLSNLVGCTVAIISAIVADSLAGSPYEETVIIALRYVGFAFAMLDMVSLLMPKEYPYAKTEELPRLSHVFTLPFKNKKFLLTISICFIYTFINSIVGGVLNYFLINSIGLSYSYTYAINLSYSLILLIFKPLWQKVFDRLGWVRTFSFALLLDIPPIILYAFITPGNHIWLWGVVRLVQHFIGVGRDPAYSNLPYMNLPKEGQTNYMTFLALGNCFFPFLGMSLGTWLVSVIGESTFPIFGFQMGAVPTLLLIQAVLTLVLAVVVEKLRPIIMPDSDRLLVRK